MGPIELVYLIAELQTAGASERECLTEIECYVDVSSEAEAVLLAADQAEIRVFACSE